MRNALDKSKYVHARGGDHQSKPAREKTMTYPRSSPGAGHQTSPFQRRSKTERTGREDEEVTEGRRDGEAEEEGGTKGRVERKSESTEG